MAMTDEIKSTFEEATQNMHEAARALREANELALKRGQADGEMKERLEKAENGIRDAEEKWKAADEARKAAEAARAELERKQAELEVKLQLLERHRGGKGTPSLDEVEAKEVLYKSAYSKALRGGLGSNAGSITERPVTKWLLTDEEKEAMNWMETKSLSSDGGETGGYLMPPAQQGELIRKLILFDPLEELASSVTLSQGDTWEAPREGDQNFDCAWVSERGTRSETTAAQFAKETITAHELYAKPLITQKMLDDPGFDVGGWLMERLVRRFRVKRGQAFTAGTGDGQPEGITVNATAIAGSATAYGYVPMGHASTIDSGDALWKVYYDLEEYYTQSATWLWQRSTSQIIRLLKDGNDNYVWAPAFETSPPTVCGRPYRESPTMPTVTTNAFSVALGDWESAYLIVRRQDVRTLRDPYSSKPFVEFYTTLRVGGAVVLNEAYRLGKVSTT